MKTLRPVPMKETYYKDVEKDIDRFFVDTIYAPIQDIVKKYLGVRINSTSSIVSAIMGHRVQFVDGRLTGKFNSSISKELKALGATYNKKGKYWRIPKGNIPPEITSASVAASQAYTDMHNEIIEHLDNVDVDAALADAGFEETYEKSVRKMNKDITKTSNKFAVSAKITKEMATNISDNYAENLKLYIKDWTEDNILKLREKVVANTFDGYRAEKLAETIQKNYGVSRSKAKFLARQETSLLMSNFRKERYKDIGITRYRWSTSKDARVRDRHEHLDGKIFSYDNPPITDDLGNRNNPGEDFNCRCVDIPIVD